MDRVLVLEVGSNLRDLKNGNTGRRSTLYGVYSDFVLERVYVYLVDGLSLVYHYVIIIKKW